MRYPDDAEKDRLGEFHNQLVTLLDTTPLSVPDVLAVLRMVTTNVERLFEIAAKSPPIEVPKTEGG